MVLCLVQFVFTLGHWAEWKFMKWSAWLKIVAVGTKSQKHWLAGFSESLDVVGWVREKRLLIRPMRPTLATVLLANACQQDHWIGWTLGQFMLFHWMAIGDDDNEHEGQQDHSIRWTVQAALLIVPWRQWRRRWRQPWWWTGPFDCEDSSRCSIESPQRE